MNIAATAVNKPTSLRIAKINANDPYTPKDTDLFHTEAKCYSEDRARELGLFGLHKSN